MKSPESKKSILVLLVVLWILPFSESVAVTAADLDYLIHVGIVSSANSPEWRVAQLTVELCKRFLCICQRVESLAGVRLALVKALLSQFDRFFHAGQASVLFRDLTLCVKNSVRHCPFLRHPAGNRSPPFMRSVYTGIIRVSNNFYEIVKIFSTRV